MQDCRSQVRSRTKLDAVTEDGNSLHTNAHLGTDAEGMKGILLIC